MGRLEEDSVGQEGSSGRGEGVLLPAPAELPTPAQKCSGTQYQVPGAHTFGVHLAIQKSCRGCSGVSPSTSSPIYLLQPEAPGYSQTLARGHLPPRRPGRMLGGVGAG